MKNLAIVQARMGATRLPGKVLKDFAGKPDIQRVIDRLSMSDKIDEIVVATSIDTANLPLISYCADHKIRVFVGSENDVLDRYYQAAKLFHPVNVIRITADCPLIDPRVVDQVIELHEKSDNDYTSNTIDVTYPDGLDTEIMTFETLHDEWKCADMASEREHVTQYLIKNSRYKKSCLYNDIDYSGMRWTLDTQEDYDFLNTVYDYFGDKMFYMDDVIAFLNEHPEVQKINGQYERNEGLAKSVREDHKVNVEDTENE